LSPTRQTEPYAVHELAVTQGILDVALEAARANNARRINAIDLVIGDLSSIVDDSVQFYFDVLSKGTLAEGAELRFRRQPAEAACWTCGHKFQVSVPLKPVCPACGSAQLHVSGGREFFVESIDVDEEEAGP
jgi:hydrogenase nickel incorporation protein HypA/HybF